MAHKNVLIIEDEIPQREALSSALKYRGFNVYEAGDVESARRIGDEIWEKLDVAILDMRLLDPNPKYTNITGADIAAEFKKKKLTSPECFVYSQFAEIQYFRLALDLGVAAYLDKGNSSTADVVRHVRALALKKALSVENPLAIRQIAQIVTHSIDRAQAVKHFCQRILSPELVESLGAPFFLILTTNGQSKYCAGNAELFAGSPQFFGTLQAIAQAGSCKSEPTVLDFNKIRKEIGLEDYEEYPGLQGAVLLPIFSSAEHRISLSMCILKEEEFDLSKFADEEEVVPPMTLPEDPEELWKVLNQYLRPTVVEHLLTIFSEWNHIKTTLREISQICIWIGQEQSALVKHSSGVNDEVIQNLRAMADDLTESGNLLRNVESPIEDLSGFSAVDFRPLLSEIWDEIVIAEGVGQVVGIEVDGDCQIEADENDLYVVFSRLLQWFLKRHSMADSTNSPIRIVGTIGETTSSVEIIDSSPRLSPAIRKELFTPFTQSVTIPFAELVRAGKGEHLPGQFLPLYIAKMIVEVKYGGELLDLTDAMQGQFGHTFGVRFSKALSAA